MAQSKEFDIDIPSGDELEKGGKGLLFGALSFVLVFGLAFATKKYFGSLIQENRFEDASEKALQVGTPENFADRLYSAIDGVGTDEDEIFAVFNELPSKSFYRKMYNAYRIITDGNDLNEDLKGDLNSADVKRTQQILATKPN